MAYHLEGHPLLSLQAKGLQVKDSDAFEAQTALAAEVLGISAITFPSSVSGSVNRWLALQLNYQLQLTPEVFYKKQESSGASHQNTTYRDNLTSLVYPPAAAGIAAILEGINGPGAGDAGWEDIRSVRRNFV